LFIGVIVGAVALFVLLSSEMRRILLQNRRWLLILIAVPLIILAIVLWSRQSVSYSVAMTLTPGLASSKQLNGGNVTAGNLTAQVQSTVEVTPELTFVVTEAVTDAHS